MSDLYTWADSIGVTIAHAMDVADGRRIAIHLLNPNQRDLEDALATAERDGFQLIMLHSNKTWRKFVK